MTARRLLSLAALGAAALAAIATSKPPSATGPVQVGYMTLDAINARKAKNASDGRVTVLHFWGTWCGPCVEEFPELARMYGRLESESRIDFVAIAVDEEKISDVSDFAAKAGARFPLYVAEAADPKAFMVGVNPNWPGVIPSTFAWTPDGRMAIEHLGAIEDTRGFEKELRALLPN